MTVERAIKRFRKLAIIAATSGTRCFACTYLRVDAKRERKSVGENLHPFGDGREKERKKGGAAAERTKERKKAREGVRTKCRGGIGAA